MARQCLQGPPPASPPPDLAGGTVLIVTRRLLHLQALPLSPRKGAEGEAGGTRGELLSFIIREMQDVVGSFTVVGGASAWVSLAGTCRGTPLS